MYYIVALGNPGEQYLDTRHNIGWHIADEVCRRFHLSLAQHNAHYLGRYTEGDIGGEAVRLLYPDTFMNHSGGAVRKFVPPADTARLIVIHDEIALPFGAFKISYGRGAGGHNGVSSIIASLGHKEFVRLRVGIAPVSWLTGRPQTVSGEALAAYVLGRLTKREQTALAMVTPTICDAVRSIVVQGVAVAMNRYNAAE